VNDPLLVTKTYLPRPRTALIPRPALFARLDAGLTGRLILVSAPAGFGKTTLLSSWIEDCRLKIADCQSDIHQSTILNQQSQIANPQFCWLTLDRSDNDPTRFWSYTIAALQTVEPGLAEDIRAALLAPSPPPLPALVSSLINAVSALGRPLILALDDYHLIQSEAIHASMNDLLDHLPPNWRVILNTREDPPLALARRRARGELAEIRAADLRFSAAETAELLNACLGLNLAAADVAALYHRTEGWAVGLHLAALSMQNRTALERQAFVKTFEGDDQFIFDYLMDEVFLHLPAEQHAFLLRTSPLERMCAALCQAVTGFEDCAERLADLERINLFIQPLDNRRHWYRYHPLFADLLRKRLHETESAETIQSLRLKAIAWCEQEDLLSEAVEYAFTTQDPEIAAGLLDRRVLEAFFRSEIHLVYQWLKALPEAVLQRYPLLCAVYADAIALVYHTPEAYAQAEGWLENAESGLEGLPQSAKKEETQAFLANFRAYLARFRGAPPAEVSRLALQALEQLPAGVMRFRSALHYLLGIACLDGAEYDRAAQAFSSAQRLGEETGDWFNALAAVDRLAYIAAERGELLQAEGLCRNELDALAKSREPAGSLPPIAGTLHIMLGTLLLEKDDQPGAEASIRRGLELLRLTTLPDRMASGHYYLARIRCAQLDIRGVQEEIHQVEAAWRMVTTPVETLKARIWLGMAAGDPAAAAAVERWAAERRLNLGVSGRREMEQLVLARWLVTRPFSLAVREHPDRAIVGEFLRRQLEEAESQGLLSWALEVLLLQALLHQAEDHPSQAQDALQRALHLAAPRGFVRTFLDFGPPLARLLGAAAHQGENKNFADRLAAAFKKSDPSAAVGNLPGGEHPGELVEPLSARELDVLRLLAEGLSNREIGDRLYLSPNTVRIHASNIYSKLGVSSRTQAVAKARALGLFPK
jgi:LuxR family maltose regulon positive regulatory protein